MIFDCLFLLAGLFLIVKGGNIFVSASVRVAEYLHMPRVVIGSTLVSLATTSPEITVSILSGLRGEPGLAVGNAVGSCICNLCLVLGVMAAVKQVATNPKTVRSAMLAMIGCGLLLLASSFNFQLGKGHGLLLVILGVFYFYYDFQKHYRAARPRELVEARRIETEMVHSHPWLRTGLGTTVLFTMGMAMVVAGSKLLIEAAVGVATEMGISPMLIGLTVIAFGTSLPELVTALSSARQNVSDLAVGNILGANVANLTLVIGSAASLSDVVIDRVTQFYSFPALVLAMFIAWHMITSKDRVSRVEGGGLLLYYVLFLAGLVALSW